MCWLIHNLAAKVHFFHETAIKIQKKFILAFNFIHLGASYLCAQQQTTFD